MSPAFASLVPSELCVVMNARSVEAVGESNSCLPRLPQVGRDVVAVHYRLSCIGWGLAWFDGEQAALDAVSGCNDERKLSDAVIDGSGDGCIDGPGDG